MAKTPNPDRVYRVIATILERRHNVKIEYTIEVKEETPHGNESAGYGT
jgi:hypothetical protein